MMKPKPVFPLPRNLASPRAARAGERFRAGPLAFTPGAYSQYAAVTLLMTPLQFLAIAGAPGRPVERDLPRLRRLRMVNIPKIQARRMPSESPSPSVMFGAWQVKRAVGHAAMERLVQAGEGNTLVQVQLYDWDRKTPMTDSLISYPFVTLYPVGRGKIRSPIVARIHR